MTGDYKTYRRWVWCGFLIFSLLFSSCKTDEFKLGELKVKDSFRTNLIIPLFAGELEFRDFIAWEDAENPDTNDSTVILEFPEGVTRKIAAEIIFNQTILVDSFPFAVQGNYELVTIILEFRVNNGTPFPLNLVMRHFEKTEPTQLGPAIQPASFDAGEISGGTIVPVPSVQRDTLNEEQRQSFIESNRIQFTTWFDKTNFINENDTLNSNYPVDISVVLIGEAKAGNEDN